jgi:hypothetical protein
MLGGLLKIANIADDELDKLVGRVLDNDRVQDCIENVTEAVAMKVTDHVLKEFAKRLESRE